jgi:hypothetical protein
MNRKFDPNKTYAIGLWDMTFYAIDCETDEPVRNEDGSVAEFRLNNNDYSYIADGLDVADLEEAQPIVHLYKGEI